MFEICHASSASHLDSVRALMRQYVGWHYQCHARYGDLTARYFDPQGFEIELNELPVAFRPPSGRLLLGLADGRPVGTVALPDLGGGVCEMKRMFVVPEAQGHGLGRALVRRLIGEAKAIGYRAMRLDTGPLQHEALRLYSGLGFVRIEAYGAHDADMRAWLTFMELDLGFIAACNTNLCVGQPV